MASLIAVLFFAIFLNKDVYCQSVVEYVDSSEEVDFTPIDSSNSLLGHLGNHEVMKGLRTKISEMGIALEESNGTELLVAKNESLECTTEDECGQHVIWHNQTESPDYENTTEARFDPSGCDTHLRDEHEEVCYENFQRLLEEAMQIEDEAEQGKQVCCASEGYERCCIIGYKEANCKADHEAIKQTLKAARMFMATLSDITCSIHRGKCGFNSAAALVPLQSVLLATLGFLPIFALL